GSLDCDGPRSRFVRVEARLWDGAGTVTAYAQLKGPGTIKKTVLTRRGSGFFEPAVSNILNTWGSVFRGCGRFTVSGEIRTFCTPWTRMPK
ncbi:MAG: hypothetical protein ACRCY8_11485, partial [Dermatophilaceae bacterium]